MCEQVCASMCLSERLKYMLGCSNVAGHVCTRGGMMGNGPGLGGDWGEVLMPVVRGMRLKTGLNPEASLP